MKKLAKTFEGLDILEWCFPGNRFCHFQLHYAIRWAIRAVIRSRPQEGARGCRCAFLDEPSFSNKKLSSAAILRATLSAWPTT